MQEHELKVLHIASGNELVVSKSYYHKSPDDYKIISGTESKVAAKEVFKQPKAKMTKQPIKNKMETKVVADKKTSLVPPPSVS